MPKINLAVICGGRSTEHQVSLLSSKNVIEAVDLNKYNLFLLAIDHQGAFRFYPSFSVEDFLVDAEDPKRISLKDSGFSEVLLTPGNDSGQFYLTKEDKYLRVDAVFPVMHGSFAEDGKMQGLLEMLDIAYVGPDVLGSAVAMDKEVAKNLLVNAGVNVAKFLTFKKYQQSEIDFKKVESELGLPVFIKPANSGSSVGVSRAKNEVEFKKAVEEAFRFDNKILIEEAMIGRELECSVIGNFGSLKAGDVGEVEPSEEHGFYSYDAKYIDEHGAALSIPANISNEKRKEIQEFAKEVFELLQCEGMARVDMFMLADGKLVLNEINTIPGFTKISMYPKLLMETGMTYSEIIDQLVSLAIERFEEQKNLSFEEF